MASFGDYRKLLNKWLNSTHTIGSPDLDALIEIQDLSGRTRQEKAMAQGAYFTSSIVGEDRAVDGVPSYIIIDTGDLYHVLEELSLDVDYINAGDGSVNITTDVFAMDSNRSDITVTGGTPVNIGVPLNLEFVNKLSTSDFIFDATVTINSGTPDFVIYASQFYKDTSGNRESLTGVRSAFFDKDRKIIMPPNKRYVFRTIVTGTSSGTLDSLAQFSFVEQETSGEV